MQGSLVSLAHLIREHCLDGSFLLLSCCPLRRYLCLCCWKMVGNWNRFRFIMILSASCLCLRRTFLGLSWAPSSVVSPICPLCPMFNFPKSDLHPLFRLYLGPYLILSVCRIKLLYSNITSNRHTIDSSNLRHKVIFIIFILVMRRNISPHLWLIKLTVKPQLIGRRGIIVWVVNYLRRIHACILG